MSPRHRHRFFVITLHAHARSTKLPPLNEKRGAIREARRQVAANGIGATADVHLVTTGAAPLLLYQARADRKGERTVVVGLEL